MPVLIPVTSDGNREIQVVFDSAVYRFRTYYSMGEMDGWLLDIADGDGKPLLVGLRITPGAANILKGHGDLFRDVQLAVAVISGKESDMDSLGRGTFLVWYEPGEENDLKASDPLIDIPIEWEYQQAITQLFLGDEAGNVYAADVIEPSVKDAIFHLDSKGNICVGTAVIPGLENDYMVVDAYGSIMVKGRNNACD